jgi:hypothetical protein
VVYAHGVEFFTAHGAVALCLMSNFSPGGMDSLRKRRARSGYLRDENPPPDGGIPNNEYRIQNKRRNGSSFPYSKIRAIRPVCGKTSA